MIRVKKRMPDRIDFDRLAAAIRTKQNGRSLAAIARESGVNVRTLKYLLEGEFPTLKVHIALFEVIAWLGVEPRTFLIEPNDEVPDEQ